MLPTGRLVVVERGTCGKTTTQAMQLPTTFITAQTIIQTGRYNSLSSATFLGRFFCTCRGKLCTRHIRSHLSLSKARGRRHGCARPLPVAPSAICSGLWTAVWPISRQHCGELGCGRTRSSSCSVTMVQVTQHGRRTIHLSDHKVMECQVRLLRALLLQVYRCLLEQTATCGQTTFR